jgi:hypothetical protein
MSQGPPANSVAVAFVVAAVETVVVVAVGRQPFVVAAVETVIVVVAVG